MRPARSRRGPRMATASGRPRGAGKLSCRITSRRTAPTRSRSQVQAGLSETAGRRRPATVIPSRVFRLISSVARSTPGRVPLQALGSDMRARRTRSSIDSDRGATRRKRSQITGPRPDRLENTRERSLRIGPAASRSGPRKRRPTSSPAGSRSRCSTKTVARRSGTELGTATRLLSCSTTARPPPSWRCRSCAA